MQNKSYSLQAALFLVLCAIVGGASASQIPLGINSSRNIFVQEIWQGQTPFLCLANRSGKNQILQVSRWNSRQVPADPLLLWKMDANSAECHDASSLMTEWLLEFKLVDGERLGLLRAPRMALAKSDDPSVFSSFQGINGTCSIPGTWIEQSGLWLKAGEVASVTLLTTVSDGDALIEFSVDTHLNLPHLQLKSATSSSLVVDEENRRLSIKAEQRTAVPAVHRVQLEFDVPEVTQPTMYLLSGRQRIADKGWQCFVRGMLVEP